MSSSSSKWLLVEDEVICDLAIQYADFGYWQQQWLQGEVLSQQVKYWKEKLTNNNNNHHNDDDDNNNYYYGSSGGSGGEVVPALQLPTDKPRPAIQTFDGGKSKSTVFSDRLCNGLEAICRGGDVTLFMILLAALEVLLYGYSGGQEHFAIGSPIANRNRSEIEGLIGFFVNTLVLKSDVVLLSLSNNRKRVVMI